MDLDSEHTFTPPTTQYLAVARLSASGEDIRPRLSKLNRKHSKDISGIEEKVSAGPGIANAFQKGKFIKDRDAPDDKRYFVLITICLYGLVQTLPYLCFFTANEYWMYKFRNTTSDSTDANDRTYLQTYFLSLIAVTVTAPGVICILIAAIAGHKIQATTRVFFVLCIHSIILILQTIFVKVDTDTWQKGFFIFTLMNQLVMSCASSLGGSGSIGLMSKLPPRYMKAMLLGEGVANVFSSVLRLISILVTPSTTGAALMYFGTGSLLMVCNTILLYIATKTPFFRYYTRSAKDDVKDNLRNFKDIVAVLKIIWPLILLLLFTSLLPTSSITNLVVSEFNGKSDSVWGSKYFVTVCTYLIPSFTGLIGRGLFNGLDLDLSMPALYVVSISQEVIFGALVFLSNAKPRHHLPVIVKHDWQYGLLTAGQSLGSGFLMNLNMIKLMKIVPSNRIELSIMSYMFFRGIISAATSPLGVLAVSLL